MFYNEDIEDILFIGLHFPCGGILSKSKQINPVLLSMLG